MEESTFDNLNLNCLLQVEAKNLDTKMLQLWGLLPVFANEAQDVSTAMVPDFAKTLGQALEARLNLRRVSGLPLPFFLSLITK